MRQTALRLFISRVGNARPLGNIAATSSAFAATTCATPMAMAATPSSFSSPSSSSFSSSAPPTSATANFFVSRRFFTGGRAKNPYKVIGVPQGASKEDIKKAYRILARKNHPDAPGGSHEKFQEIQQAYEQIKTGIWIPKEGEGGAAGGGGAGGGNTFAGFKFTTATSKGKVSYDDFMKEMHTGRAAEGDFDTGPESAAAKARKAAVGANDTRIQAWFRLLSLWATVFLTLRVTMMLLFPRRAEKKLRAPPAPRMRKEPPPPPSMTPRAAIAA